jgi:hypothetical protein
LRGVAASPGGCSGRGGWTGAASPGVGKAPLRRGSRQPFAVVDLVVVAFRSGGPLPLPHGTAAADWVTGAADPGAGNQIWLVAAGSSKRVAKSGEQRPNPMSEWPPLASGHNDSADPTSGAACFLFNLLRRASNHLGKGPVYRDLSTEVVAMPVSVNQICSPR